MYRCAYVCINMGEPARTATAREKAMPTSAFNLYYIQIHSNIYIYFYIRIYMYLFIFIYLYMYIYIYIHTYVCM